MDDLNQQLSQAEGAGGQRLSAAVEDFRRARRRAALHAVLARLNGTSLALLSFEEIADKLQVTGQVDRGLREIPVEKIIGSVGRYDDFDRSFLPLKDFDAQRWASVRMASQYPGELPPIEVYQIGESYFVIDGNHRVSIARQTGTDFLSAHVVEVRTREPLPPDLQQDKLIIASERVAFLAATHLDRLRPEEDLRVTLPGQFDKLENHIEVHRYFWETAEDRTLTDQEAVLHWFDHVYQPVVAVIREQGLLRGFDGRTETDLYLWIAENQAELHNELGWEVAPQNVAGKLAAREVAERESKLGRIYRSFIHAVQPDRAPDGPTWSTQKRLDRYSDRLFAEILVVVDGQLTNAALMQAMVIARLDQAHLLALRFVKSRSQPDPADRTQTQANLAQALQQQGLSGEVGFEADPPRDVIQRLALLADMIVLDRGMLLDDGDVHTIIARCARPLLLVNESASTVERILLPVEDHRATHEAAFIATYMAEVWGCDVVLLADNSLAESVIDQVQQYMGLHEVTGELVLSSSLSPQRLQSAAADHNCDLIVVGGRERGPLSRFVLGEWALEQGPEQQRPLLICP